MKNKFFGSKLNTVLLVVLIILMVVALKWMLENKHKYIPDNTKDTESFVNIPFFKSLIKEGPDSVIFECTLLNNKYFSFHFDKVENGSHVLGGGTALYTPDGSNVDSCPMNPTVKKSQLCRELEKPNASCKEVYLKNGYEGSVDVYNLAK